MPTVRTTGSDIRDQLAGLGARRTGGRRPARVLVIGNFGNGNTGDEALLAAALQHLPADAEPVVLSRDPVQVRATHGVAALRMAFLPFAGALRRCDALLVVGGGMFGAGLPPLVRALPRVVDAARLLGLDTAYVAIGAYPGMPAGVLRRLRSAARRPGRVTVRDRLSAATLGGGVPDVGDLALRLQPDPVEHADRALRDAGVALDAPLLLLSLKALPRADRMAAQREVALHAARRWRERGGTVAALALSTQADYGLGPARSDAVLARELAGELGPLPVVGPLLPPALAKAVVARAAGVLGLRLHALVFAAGTGVRCAGFPWEEKTRAFLAAAPRATVVDAEAPESVTGWVDATLEGLTTR